MCLALKVKKCESWRARLRENPPLWSPQFSLGLVYFKYIYPLRKFDPSSCSGLKLQNFGGPD